jgi:hypothetical protein
MQHQIPNKRKYHLAYCKICHYRDYTHEKGITCFLTKDIADFDVECSSMQPDYEVMEDRQIEVHNKISTYVNSTYTIDSYFRSNYIKPSHSFTPKYHTKEKTHQLKFRAKNHNSTWTLSGLLVLFISFGVTLESEQKIYKYLFGLLLFISVCFLLIRLIIEYYTPKKVLLSTDEKGFTLLDKQFFWHDVIDFRIFRVSSKRSTSRYLILGTITEDLQLFDITNVGIKDDELVEIFHLNRKAYFTRHKRHLPDII